MITITAASSQFGRAVLDELLSGGSSPESIVATARETTSLSTYADRGVQVRFADYEDAGSLDAAFHDLDRLLLISSNSPAAQAAQHANVVEAAKRANATEIVYTSYLNADTSGIQMAQPHAETEQIIRGSGIPFAFLRNGSYIENSAGFVGFWVQYGEAVGSAGDGLISGAARKDLAIAAARVIAGDVVNGEVYELGGSDYTMQDLVTVAAELSGKPITYNNLPKEAYAGVLVSGGLPEGLAAAIADNNAGAARGAWKTTSTALTDILGRPTTPPREVFAQALEHLN